MACKNTIVIAGLLPFFNWHNDSRIVLNVEGCSSALQTQANTKLQKVLIEYEL